MRRCSHPIKKLIPHGEEMICGCCGRVVVGKQLPDAVIAAFDQMHRDGYRGAFSLVTGERV